MKQFVVVHHGHVPPTPSVRAAWNEWVERRAESIADIGCAFGPGRLITNDRTYDLTLDSNPANGYSVVWAVHLDAAEQLLEGCPIVDSVSLYEALGPIGGQGHPRTRSTEHRKANR